MKWRYRLTKDVVPGVAPYCVERRAGWGNWELVSRIVSPQAFYAVAEEDARNRKWETLYLTIDASTLRS